VEVRRAKAVSKNLNCFFAHAKFIAEALNISESISTYYARHSWATIARNDCNVSKSDIAECLNHSTNTITDIYIKKDWKTIDNANKKVIDLKSVKNNRSNKQKRVKN